MSLYKELTVLKYGNYYFYFGLRETYEDKTFAPNELLVRNGIYLDSYVALIDAGIDPILGDYTRVVMQGLFYLENLKNQKDRTIWNSYFLNSYSLDLVITVSQTKEIIRVPFDNEAFELVKKRFAERSLKQLIHERILEGELEIHNELFEISEELFKKRSKKTCQK